VKTHFYRRTLTYALHPAALTAADNLPLAFHLNQPDDHNPRQGSRRLEQNLIRLRRV
jgi:hypothetical protein